MHHQLLAHGRWVVRLNVEAPAFHPAMRQTKTEHETVGIDRGLKAFAVAATPAGEERWRVTAPKPLFHHLKKLRRLSRQLSFKKRHSKNGARAQHRLARLHHRIRNIRNIRSSHVHRLTRTVAQTHVHVVLEDLHIAGMLRHRSLSRSIADSCWGVFAQQLRYKGTWYGCQVSDVSRFAPTRRS